jgi:hypothetical protein
MATLNNQRVIFIKSPWEEAADCKRRHRETNSMMAITAKAKALS